MTRKQGFTLLELLLVLVVVGILAALGFSTFIGAQRNAQLQEAVTQFATDLQRARSAAQRDNQNAGVALLTEDPSSYTLTIDGKTTVRKMPHGTQVQMVGQRGDSVTYRAPYGEIGIGDTSFAVSSARVDKVRRVRVIGVTGKVVLSDL